MVVTMILDIGAFLVVCQGLKSLESWNGMVNLARVRP